MAKVQSIRGKSAKRTARPKVHQFLIVLSGTEPIVWRRIQTKLMTSGIPGAFLIPAHVAKGG